MTYAEFKEVYRKAWEMGCKGITTFRISGKRYGILNETVEEEETSEVKIKSFGKTSSEEATACFIDPNTGLRECS